MVNTVPPTIATYGAYLFQLVKFHCQIAGRMLAPYSSTARREHGVERQHVYRPLEIAPQDAGKMVAGKYPATAPAAERKLGGIGFAKPRTATGDDAQFPRMLFERLRNPILARRVRRRRGRRRRPFLRGDGGRQNQTAKKCGDPFHIISCLL